KMALSNINALLDRQLITGEEIQNVIRNYKKDSPERKQQPDYFQKRIEKLVKLWEIFFKDDLIIKSTTEGAKIEHSYFKNNYFNQIRDLVVSYKGEFNKQLSTVQMDTGSVASSEEESELEPMIREQRALLISLERIMNKMTNETRQGFMPIINQYWDKITTIHIEIYKKFE
ncbi:hypothetical protein KR074_010659, partial [Drosophila pseudoananassae]